MILKTTTGPRRGVTCLLAGISEKVGRNLRKFDIPVRLERQLRKRQDFQKIHRRYLQDNTVADK